MGDVMKGLLSVVGMKSAATTRAVKAGEAVKNKGIEDAAFAEESAKKTNESRKRRMSGIASPLKPTSLLNPLGE